MVYLGSLVLYLKEIHLYHALFYISLYSALPQAGS